jgi:hypothetical protein
MNIEILKRLEKKATQEGDLIFGLTGLDFFAAHAPPVPKGWEIAHGKGLTDAQLLAKWSWEYAQAMIDMKPKHKDEAEK